MARGPSPWLSSASTRPCQGTSEDVCCGDTLDGRCSCTSALSASNSGTSSTGPSSVPALASAARYALSVFGPMPNSRATSRAPVPMRCNRTNSLNLSMSTLR
ncbi:hypothetical protein BHS06_29820 [Myxococcus xanthus]|nr:hypothetical protein BHS06_29820 [Myxococcus xanthus]